jgi:hypothetical protein
MWKKERGRLRALITKLDAQQAKMDRLVKEADSLLGSLRKKKAARSAGTRKKKATRKKKTARRSRQSRK